MKRTAVIAAFSLAACSGAHLEDGRTPTGSQTMTTSSDFAALYSVSEDDGVIARIDAKSGNVSALDVGGHPARVARAGQLVFVSLRSERTVLVLRDDGSALGEVKRIAVGAEPVGLVANEAGTFVYVAESTQQRVSEIDTTTLEVTRSWAVDHQPSWVALHPSNDTLFVASALQGKLHRIDLSSDEVHEIEFDPMIVETESGEGELARRITGDLSVTPDGENLLVPLFLVDNVSIIDEDTNTDPFSGGGGGYDRQGRFNPAIAIIEVNSHGKPESPSDYEFVAVNSFTSRGSFTGYPTSVTASPDGNTMIVTIEGASTAIAMGLKDFESGHDIATKVDSSAPRADFSDSPSREPGFGGVFVPLEFRTTVSMQLRAGPNGAVFVDDETAWVYNFIDRYASQINYAPATETLIPRGDNDVFIDILLPVDSVKVTDKTLPAGVEAGRRMFFATNDARVSSVNAGVSCGTCHFRGGNDGLTWRFDRGGRNTPSLAGKVSATAPVRWDGSRDTVADDAFQTSQGPMGGRGLGHNDAEEIAAFIDWTRDLDLPLRGSTDDRVARGKAIFERTDVGCASCHNGERLTDNKTYQMFGINAQTRSLIGVAATPPYMHDGSVATLKDLVRASASNGMGNTSELSAQEMDDLQAYVESL